MKLLSDILYRTGIEEVHGNTNIAIVDICFDSRKVISGSLFVAINGSTVNGHQYIDQVVQNGATAVICEKFPNSLLPNVTYVKVNNSSFALAVAAANYFDNPSEKLKLIGITGTNGKTTTVTLLFSLFKQLGYRCGLLSTVKNVIDDKVVEATHTTPDPIQLNGLLAQMVESNCTHCFMEVSSHAVVQHRIAGLQFDGALFTNITRDHLDYHQTFENYIKAKQQFFTVLKSSAFALYNADDKNGSIMIQNTKARTKSYSIKSIADYKAKVLESNFSGLLLNINGKDVHCRLVGNFNAYNLLSVFAIAVESGEEQLNVLTAMSNLLPPEGRFEYLTSENGITGIIDYAHTPDALENVLKTIKDIRTGNEQVITIIGCGGDRDSGKRPLMSAIACELSDKVILTSDNPRSEEPQVIIDQMKAGVPAQFYRKTLSIVDRKEAVRTAVALAHSGDIILLAGKGHEKYQEIKGVKFPFDDKEILLESFQY